MEKKYLTISETAEYFNVSSTTIRRWINKGLIKTLEVGESKLKKTIRISQHQIRNFEMRMGKIKEKKNKSRPTITRQD